MKKSDKLLLGGFLTGLLLISAIHITLYAKYKAGNYMLYSRQDELAAAIQSFPNILFVSVRDVPGASIRFGETAAVNKDAAEYLQYVQKGDTLVINRKPGANTNNDWQDVNISLPGNARLTAYNSSLYFRPGKNGAASNCTLQLQRSRAVFMGGEAPFKLGGLNVAASDSSAITFRGNTQVSNLAVQLSNSTFEYNEGDVGQFSLQTDSASRISLQAKLLARAGIKTIAPQ